MLLECLEEEVTSKNFYCHNQGMKSNKEKGEKAYTKVDFRTGCKAMIEFRLNDKDSWTISRHDEGFVKMTVTESKLVKHANEVYTIGAYRLFEKQFMRFSEYCQELVVCNEGEHVYEVWHPDIIGFRHTYILKRWTKDIDLSLGNNSFGDLGKVSKKDIVGCNA
ncbi:hypothetical protein M9H77_18479 [Catharanthus roseus]|uniref:Uncharacterized protein n=1 Tax=Catharanthus roseus TaxID=4058 RepID=A0ACC0B7K4_CATRO|nr:hypothetical protein M9H77_18479 [Catharanthus roseus]